MVSYNPHRVCHWIAVNFHTERKHGEQKLQHDHEFRKLSNSVMPDFIRFKIDKWSRDTYRTRFLAKYGAKCSQKWVHNFRSNPAVWYTNITQKLHTENITCSSKYVCT